MPYSKDYIKSKLRKELDTVHLKIEDESDECGAKFSVVIVSPKFEGKTLLERHRLVNSVLEEELKEIHAFSQRTLTPEQWEKEKSQEMAQSNDNKVHIELMAPGKIILFGEHSVVYGQKAIAASLGLYTKLFLTENDSGNVMLKLTPIGVEEIFSLSVLHEYFTANNDATPKENVLHITENVEAFYAKYGRKSLTRGQMFSLITFFHCFSYFTEPCSGFNIEVETDLPIGSGVGSSASYSVIISTALLLLQLAKSNKLSHLIFRSDDNSITITDELKELISEKAFSCETIFHGYPSGIDDCVVLHGSIVEFTKIDGVKKLKPVESGVIKVLLVDTKIQRSTKKQVEIFKSWRDKFPTVVNAILDAMGNIANEATGVLHDLKVKPNAMEEHETKLAELIEVNHGLLKVLGVSHECLEKICNIEKKYELSAKLTGAGGGGFGYIYVPRRASAAVIHDLREELETAGFDVREVILGGRGLTINSLSF